MKVPSSKDLANHADPELCGRGRKVAFEALEKVAQSANAVQIAGGTSVELDLKLQTISICQKG